MPLDLDHLQLGCVNHNPEALALHAANHSKALRNAEGAWRIAPLDFASLDVEAASFSPPCRLFSKVKAGKPVGEYR